MSNHIDVKLFIASSGELEAERKESVALIAELDKLFPNLNLEPVLFELDTPSGNVQFEKGIQDGISPKLKESHIAVILFYSKAGEFTVEELELALKLEKKVFVYFKEGFAPNGVDETIKYLKVQELKAKFDEESAIRYQTYKTLKDFNGLLYKDLHKYLFDTYSTDSNGSAGAALAMVSTSYQHVPIAPRPYLAHPYAIVKNFTGRREEMTRLTEWFKFDKEPMCVVEAIGGMGKSALCWRWLQDEIIAKDEKVGGVVWWSFYDQGFEDFIHHIYEYCVPQHVRKLQRRIDETTEAIRALTNHRFLVVLDGFERVLSGYAQVMAMYIQERGLSQKSIYDMNEAYDVKQRTPVSPKAEKLLRALSAGNSKTLITSRLYPATVEGLAGIKHILLTGLSKTDAIAFFKTEAITGTDAEVIRAGAIYGFHPLMLKLLSAAIKRSFSPNIKRALNEAFSKGVIDEKEPRKILTKSYQLLNPEEQNLASTLSVFRATFTFDAAKALFPYMESERLEEIMIELLNLGFLLFNADQGLFDFHPILRSYLYDGLANRDKAHHLALGYFNALPVKEKIITLADIEPVIEQYYHLIRAKQYTNAANLFRRRLRTPIFFQLAQYNLCISLCNQLIPLLSDLLPQSGNKDVLSEMLNLRGLCYAYAGQLDKANESLISSMTIWYKPNGDSSLGIKMGNLAEFVLMPSGKISGSTIHLLKSITLLEAADPHNAAVNYRVLGNLLTVRAVYSATNDAFGADGYLQTSMDYTTQKRQIGLLISITLEYTKWMLAQVNTRENGYSLQTSALNWSLKAMDYTEQYRVHYHPVLDYFLYAYEAMSRALTAAIASNVQLRIEGGQVFFYDEYFQYIVDTVIPVQSNYLPLAERCVNEGLSLSRKTNRVYIECTFSLLLAQVEWHRKTTKQNGLEHFTEVEEILTETYALAIRIEFHGLLAELHIFCAEVLIELKGTHSRRKEMLLNCSAAEHLKKAREYAIDTSTYKDLFLPPDGSADDFYKEIPEYEMLKRGLTDEERIKNGYYAARLRADKLEEKLGSKL